MNACDGTPSNADEPVEVAALVDALRAGERWAPAALFDRYGHYVRAIVLHVLGPRSDATDVLHDVFVTAFEDVHQLKNPQALRGWLASIAVFRSKNYLRSRRRFGLLFSAPDVRVVRPPAPATPAVSAALRSAYEVLDELDVEERIPFVLRAVQGFSLDEVAEACGVSLATAKRRVASARATFIRLSSKRPLLREWLGDNAHD